MRRNVWGHHVVQSVGELNIIRLYAIEKEPGVYEDIAMSEEGLRNMHPEIGDEVVKGYGLVFRKNGMCPDASDLFYSTLDAAKKEANEYVEEALAESSQLTLPNMPMTVGDLSTALSGVSPTDILSVELSDEGMVEGAGMGIALAHPGFDWDMGKLLLRPIKPLVQQKSAVPLSPKQQVILQGVFEELAMYRQTDAESREMTTNGLYADECELIKQLGLVERKRADLDKSA